MATEAGLSPWPPASQLHLGAQLQQTLGSFLSCGHLGPVPTPGPLHVLLCFPHVFPPPRAFSDALDESSHVHLLSAAPPLKAWLHTWASKMTLHHVSVYGSAACPSQQHCESTILLTQASLVPALSWQTEELALCFLTEHTGRN